MPDKKSRCDTQEEHQLLCAPGGRQIIQESTIAATRHAPGEWMPQLSQPWIAGMEATLSTAWICDHLVSGGDMVKVAWHIRPCCRLSLPGRRRTIA